MESLIAVIDGWIMLINMIMLGLGGLAIGAGLWLMWNETKRDEWPDKKTWRRVAGFVVDLVFIVGGGWAVWSACAGLLPESGVVVGPILTGAVLVGLALEWIVCQLAYWIPCGLARLFLR